MDMLILPGSLDSLGVIGHYVMDAAKAAGIEKRRAYRLRQAVDEIATNSVMHGYDEAGLTGELRIYDTMDDDTMTIILEDEGEPFDPRQIPPPAHASLPVAERPIGGLGVYLALQDVDDFQYERVGKRNRHRFIVHRL